MSAHSSMVRVATSPAGVIVENQPWYLPHELQKRFMSLVLALYSIGLVIGLALAMNMVIKESWKTKLMDLKCYILLAILAGYAFFTVTILEIINHDVKIHNPYSLLCFIARTFVTVAFVVLIQKATNTISVVSCLVFMLIGILVALLAINYFNWVFRKFTWVIATGVIVLLVLIASLFIYYYFWRNLVQLSLSALIAFIILAGILIRLFFLINGSVYDLESDMGTYGRNLLYI